MKELPIIQCLWIGTKLSEMELLSIRSYLHHGHAVHLYTYDEVENLPAGIRKMDANQIISEEKIFKYRDHDSYAGFANLFRYKLLLEKGGYWSDLDIICLKNLEENGCLYEFASERNPQGRIMVNNCYIHVPKNSEVMEYCYLTALSKDPKQLVWGQTGPRLLTEAVVRFQLHEFVLRPEVVCPVSPWQYRRFLMEPGHQLFDDETYLVHLWNEMWRRNGTNKSVQYTNGCFYGEMQRMYDL